MKALLDLLKKNARTSLEDIAKQLTLSTEEVAEKIQALEKNGTILGYQAVVDPEKANHGDVTALIEVRITPERDGGFDRIASRIAKFDEVISCYLISGGYDLLVVVRGHDLREVARFVSERLSTIEGILSTATRFHLKSYKENGLLLTAQPDTTRLAVSP